MRWFEVAAVTVVMAVGGLTICLGACAWLSPRALDWVAAQADSRAFALRTYRRERAASLEEQLRVRSERAMGEA